MIQNAEALSKEMEELRTAFVTDNLGLYSSTQTRNKTQQAMATKSQEIDAQQQELSRLSLNPDELTKKLMNVAAQEERSASDADHMSEQSEAMDANAASAAVGT